MDEGLVRIILAVISLLGAIITGVLVPYLKTKYDANKMAQIQFWVEVAVKGAEQIFTDPQSGEQKKQYVIDYLNSKGVKITMEDLDMLIEAAVKELNLEQSFYLGED